jgi:hypothetical protein
MRHGSLVLALLAGAFVAWASFQAAHVFEQVAAVLPH